MSLVSLNITNLQHIPTVHVRSQLGGEILLSLSCDGI